MHRLEREIVHKAEVKLKELSKELNFFKDKVSNIVKEEEDLWDHLNDLVNEIETTRKDIRDLEDIELQYEEMIAEIETDMNAYSEDIRDYKLY